MFQIFFEKKFFLDFLIVITVIFNFAALSLIFLFQILSIFSLFLKNWPWIIMNNNNIIVPPPSHQLPNQPNQSMAMAPQMVHQMTQLNVYQAHYRAQLQLRAQQAQAQAQAQMAHQAQMTPQMGQRTVSQASSCTATPLLTPQQTPMHTPTPEQLKQKEMMDRICWETFLVEGDVSKEVTVHGKVCMHRIHRNARGIVLSANTELTEMHRI